MSEFLDKIEKTVLELLDKAQKDPHFRASKDLATVVTDISEDIEKQLTEQNDKSVKAKLLLNKGKVIDILDTYSKEAEDALSRALKLDPSTKETWILLGNTLWKKKDYVGAKKAFESCIDNCGKNKEALRSLSMVLRFVDTDESKDKTNLVTQSLDLAKEAVGLDFKDSESWYILGNAYLSNYFKNVKKVDELLNALKAYNQAETQTGNKPADLYYNKATVQGYLEDYEDAIKNYRRASELDLSVDTKANIEHILERVKHIDNHIANKGKVKPKQLALLLKDIPTVLKAQPKELGDHKYEVRSLSDLKEGANPGVILACKITNVLSQKGEVPAKFVFVDSKGLFAALSIYHCNNDIYTQAKEESDVFIVDPKLKKVSVNYSAEKVIEYVTVQVLDPPKIYINSKLATTAFSPSQLITKTQ